MENEKQSIRKTKISKVALVIVVVIIAGFIYAMRQVSNVNNAINNMNKEREASEKEVNALTDRLKNLANVSVVSSKQKNTSYGSTSIVGEVINNGNDSATFVKVTATFYDANNEVVDTNFTYAGDTAGTALQKGKTAPFEILLINKTKFDHYKLDVSWN